ncbi:MAG: L-threonylcarbamoyladenylate synthase [Acidimicrobiales bacterium]
MTVRAPVVPAFGDPPPAAAIDSAVVALAAGRLVGLPTDTLYGLVGPADAIYAAKGRPAGIHLPVLVADRHAVTELVGPVPPLAARLMDAFWPGGLTVVVARRGGGTVGLRCPDHPVTLAVCRAAGPQPSSSANRHGRAPLTTAAAVAAAFGDGLAVVLDSGPCAGSPSTVVDCTGQRPVLLREGRVAWAAVQAVAGREGS